MDEITRRRPPQPVRLSRAALGRLKQPLPPELVSERTTGHGEVLRYIEGWRAIEQANAVFGHDRWGAELVGEVTCRELPETGGGDAPVALYTATVRVTAWGVVSPSSSDRYRASEVGARRFILLCVEAQRGDRHDP